MSSLVALLGDDVGDDDDDDASFDPDAEGGDDEFAHIDEDTDDDAEDDDDDDDDDEEEDEDEDDNEDEDEDDAGDDGVPFGGRVTYEELDPNVCHDAEPVDDEEFFSRSRYWSPTLRALLKGSMELGDPRSTTGLLVGVAPMLLHATDGEHPERPARMVAIYHELVEQVCAHARVPLPATAGAPQPSRC